MLVNYHLLTTMTLPPSLLKEIMLRTVSCINLDPPLNKEEKCFLCSETNTATTATRYI